MNSMGLKFMAVHNFGQSFVLILKGNNLGLSLSCQSICPFHTSRNCAGNRWLRGIATTLPSVANQLQYIAVIVNGCQRLATFSNCLKKLPSVAVVSSIVNELLVSLQLF